MTSTRRRPSAGRRLSGLALWLVGTVPFLTRLSLGRTSNDVVHYFDVATAALEGHRIYVDVPFEYPPYALVWFLGPAWAAAEVADFRLGFGLLIWAFDAAIKGGLLWLGFRALDRPPDVRPFVTYSLATAALGHILLQRYDVIPAALVLAAVFAMWRHRPGLSGVLAGIAAGTKVYPIIILPVLAAVAWRRGGGRRVLVGLAAGVMPLVLLAWWVPWWEFARVHVERGLQVESIWASMIWLLHYMGVPAQWERATAWIEVTGPVAAWVVGPARSVCALGTAIAATLATGAALRAPWRHEAASLPTLALLTLFPLTVFVVTNPVLSPQYHLWLMPLAAVVLSRAGAEDEGLRRGARTAAWCLFVAALLVPAYFPSRTFDAGLDLGRTLVLVLRNLLLAAAAWGLAQSVWGIARPRTPTDMSV